MKYQFIKYLPAPLLLLGFTGVQLKYFDLIFTLNSRWLILLFVFVFVVINKNFKILFYLKSFLFSILYAIWAIITTIWSENQLLSMMKSISLLLVIIASVGIGIIIVKNNVNNNKSLLDSMIPMVIMFAISTIFGFDLTSNSLISEKVSMFQGGTGDSNTFGFYCAMSLPVLLWKLENSIKNKERYFFSAANILVFLLLIKSNCRTAIVFAVVIILFFYYWNGKANNLVLLYKGILIVLIVSLLVPDFTENAIYNIIYKGNTNGSITESRDTVWQESYNQAISGGFFGGGYGVTIGEGNDFTGALSSYGYGREKGNAQLGIIEETGLIGLVLYFISTFWVIIGVQKRLKKCIDAKEKKLLGIIIGTLLGLFLSSLTEAWYNAPGSPESVYYWFIVGIAIGISKQDISTDTNSNYINTNNRSVINHSVLV